MVAVLIIDIFKQGLLSHLAYIRMWLERATKQPRHLVWTKDWIEPSAIPD